MILENRNQCPVIFQVVTNEHGEWIAIDDAGVIIARAVFEYDPDIHTEEGAVKTTLSKLYPAIVKYFGV